MAYKIKVLYIDSEEEFGRELLNHLIESQYQVKYCKSLKEGLLEYKKEYDIIIVEQNIKDGKGIELLQKIRLQGIKSMLVLLSYGENSSLLLKALELKVDKFIDKKENILHIVSEISSLKPTTHIEQIDYLFL